MTDRKINKEATIEKIKEVAKDKIKDIELFNKQIQDEEFFIDSLLMWRVIPIYE